MALKQETQDPTLRQKGKELHETNPCWQGLQPFSAGGTEEKTSHPSTSILVIRGFMTLRKEAGRKVS